LASFLEAMDVEDVVSLPLLLLKDSFDLIDLFIDVFLRLPFSSALLQQTSCREVND
jgi:hypothetical protein